MLKDMFQKMKIGILGTRGIPNNYGGFEQFAEFLSELLVKRGHVVYVYNSHNHPFKEDKWKGVNIIHCKDPEKKIGTVGQFIYDLNCILDSRKRDFDIILQLGYGSSSVWNKFLPKRSVIITNMDGLEWKRSKFSLFVQNFLLFAEKLAVNSSDYMIADSLGIQNYLKQKYSINARYIPYGADLINKFNEDLLSDFSINKYQYYLVIARMEPENNIQNILQGFLDANDKRKMIVIGSTETNYGRYIKKKYQNKHIAFLGYISDQEKLNVLRRFSYIYFHGHSVGGTNPSLLEAMAAGSLICAHKNEFNQSILGSDALYFTSSSDLTNIIDRNYDDQREEYVSNNLKKIQSKYSWHNIVSQYESLMNDALKEIK